MIEVVQARVFLKALPNSATGPAIFECRDHSGHIGEWIVKFAPSLGRRRLLCECCAALMARLVGLSVPDCAIVQMPDALRASIHDAPVREKAIPGLHFGSRRVPGANEYEANFSLRPIDRGRAFKIFAFDMLIQNVDRTSGPPFGKRNLLNANDDFWLIDHEKGFSFLSVIGPPLSPYELRGQSWVTNHLFYSRLRGCDDLPFDEFMATLCRLSDGELWSQCAAIPPDWRAGEDLVKIRCHLEEICSHPAQFEYGLREALA